MRLDDKVCIVTGASSGIGRGVAEAFTAEGAQVVLVAHPADDDDLSSLSTAVGDRAALALAIDLGAAGTAGQILSECLDRFGRVDVLVNNAGFADVGPFADVPVERWQRVLDVNLRSMFLLSQAFVRHAIDRGGGGAIVNTASTNAFRPEPLLIAYNVSKAGVIGLTKTLALELGVHGIRVNAVLPGMVATRQTEGLLGEPRFHQAYASAIPLGRVAEPADLAPAFVFLASDEARYVTGACLVVDGGLSVGISWPEMDVDYPDLAGREER